MGRSGLFGFEYCCIGRELLKPRFGYLALLPQCFQLLPHLISFDQS